MPNKDAIRCSLFAVRKSNKQSFSTNGQWLKANGKSKGFTLIELLIVITIIGILTLMATFSYNNAQIRARDSKRKQDLKTIKSVLQLYFEDNDAYPGTLTSASNSLGPYISPIPVDPRLGTSYIYSSTSNTYGLTACLENPNDSQKDAVKNSSCSTPASYTITNPG